MNIDGTEIIINDFDDIKDREALCYLKLAREKVPGEFIRELVISKTDEGRVDLDFAAKPPNFERIRRITGYLVGTIDRWNNAKRAEEHDWVKHGIAI